MYQVGMNDCLNGRKNWVSCVKQLLDTYGFSEAFTNNINVNVFPIIFKQRVIDCFVQEWNCSVEKSNVLDEYKYCKNSLSYEP